MINRQFQQINTDAAEYLLQLTTSLENDTDYTTHVDELSMREAQAKEFDHMEHILKIRPQGVILVDILNGVNDWARAYNKYDSNELLENCRDYVANTISAHLRETKPRFEKLTAEQAMAYRLFLDNLSMNYLADRKSLRNILKDLQGQAETAIGTKLNQAIHKEFGKLQQQNQTFNIKLNTIHADIIRGYQLCQESLGGIRNQADGNHAEHQKQVAEVLEKMKEMGIAIDDSLQTIVTQNQEVRSRVIEMHSYLKAQAQRQAREDKAREIKANFEGVAATFGFLGALGAHLKNKDLQRVATIGVACTKIAEATMMLHGITALGFGALNPIMAIGMGGLAIFDVFAKQEPDTSQLILNAIHAVAEQLHMVRLEMHQRFDRLELILEIIGKRISKIFDGICELRQDNKQIHAIATEILATLREGQRQVQGSLDTLHMRLKGIADHQHDAERKRKLNEIYKFLNRFLSGYSLDDHEFKKSFNDLILEICDLQFDSCLVGRWTEPHAVIDKLEKDSCDPYFAEFNITTLCQVASEKTNGLIPNRNVVNPILWIWQTLGLMLLAQKRYPLEEVKNPISEGEFNELQRVLSVGNDLKKFIHSLQNENVLMRLHREYAESALQFHKAFARSVQEETQKLTTQLTTAWQNRLDTSIRQTMSVFRQQEIKTTDIIAGNWFACYAQETPGQRKELGRDTAHAKTAIKTYHDDRLASINKAKDRYLSMAQTPLLDAKQNHVISQIQNPPTSKQQFQYFSEAKIEPHSYFGFVYPEEPSHPILHMATGYQPYIPPVAFQAEWLGLAQIFVKYRIEQGQFILTTYLIGEGFKVPIAPSLIKPFVPGVYQGNEAIWWYWVGGNYSADGSASSKRYDHAHNAVPYYGEWDIDWYINLPNCKDVTGLCDTLFHRPTPQATEMKGIEQVNEMVSAKQKELSLIISNKLKSYLNDHSHPLSLAIVKFSNCYYMLRAALTLGFHDHVVDSPRWKYFAAIENYLPNSFSLTNVGGEAKISSPLRAAEVFILRNRDDLIYLLEHYQGGNLSLHQHCYQNVAYVQEALRDSIQNLLQIHGAGNLHYKQLSDAFGKFQDLMKYYEKSKVPQNKLTAGNNDAAVIRELKNQVDQQGKLLLMLKELGKAVSEIMTPQQQEMLAVRVDAQSLRMLMPPERKQGVTNNNSSSGCGVSSAGAHLTLFGHAEPQANRQASLLHNLGNPVVGRAELPRIAASAEIQSNEGAVSPKDPAPESHRPDKPGMGLSL